MNALTVQQCNYVSTGVSFLILSWFALEESTNPDSELPMVRVEKRCFLSSPSSLALAPLQFGISDTQ